MAEGSACLCRPGEAGTATAGQPCTSGDLAPLAGNCAAGLMCVADAALPWWSTACTTADDCAATDYPLNAECVGGFCGSTFCAPRCEADGTCATGWEPFDDTTAACWCLPVPATGA
jgi:hypothetical protein